MLKSRLALALAIGNLGVFMLVSAFLPRQGMYSYTNVIERYFVARANWDIAVGATVGTILLSLMVLILVDRPKRDVTA